MPQSNRLFFFDSEKNFFEAKKRFFFFKFLTFLAFLIFFVGMAPVCWGASSLRDFQENQEESSFSKNYSLSAVVGSQNSFFSWGLEGSFRYSQRASEDLSQQVAPVFRYQQSLAFRAHESVQFFRASLPWLFFLESSSLLVGPQTSVTYVTGTRVPYFFSFGGRVSVEWFSWLTTVLAELPLSQSQQASFLSVELASIETSSGQRFFDKIGLRYERSDYEFVSRRVPQSREEESWYVVLGVIF